MTVSATLKFKTAIKKKGFEDFAAQNGIKKKRNGYYYLSKDVVNILLDGSEICVSSSNCLSCAFIAKKILKSFAGEYICDEHLRFYMPPDLKGEI
jgi:hypothetical protein